MARLSGAKHATLFAENRLRVFSILNTDQMKKRDRLIAVFRLILEQETRSGTTFLLTIPDKAVYIVIGLSNQPMSLPKHGRGADDFFGYLYQRYGLNEREETTKFIYDCVRLHAWQFGAQVELRRFAFFDKKEEALYLSRYDGTAYKLDGDSVSIVRNGDGVYFADDDNGIHCDNVRIDHNEKLLDTLTSLSFADDTPGGITPDLQRKAITVWLFALAFPDLMPTKPLLLFEGAAGSGKCLGLGTKVLRYDGISVPVETIKVGDKLMGPDSKPRKVIGTTQGRGLLYRINPTKGDPWICNAEHILTLVRSGRCDGDIHDLPLKDFIHGSKTLQKDYKQFFTSVEFPKQAKQLPIDPYFLGFWYGDGTKDLGSVSVSKPDPEVEQLANEVAVEWKLKVRKFINTSGCPGYAITSGIQNGSKDRNPLLTMLRNVVRDGTLLPQEYLTASRKDRAKFLAGYLDADGYLDRNCYEIVQKSRGFADGICFLARSLGLRVTMSAKYIDGYEDPYWRMHISGSLDWLPMRIPRKKAYPRHQIKNVTRTGITVEAIGKGAYAGFTLDGDGRFLLGDFTVTHNSSATQLIQLALMGAKKPMILQRNKEDDFGVILLRSPIAVFDNTDSFIDWVPDAVCSYTTSGMWTKRKFYTDNEEITIKPHAFIAIASKNPASFRREDTADRCILIRLQRIKGSQRQEGLEANILLNRGELFGEYLFFANQIVRKIREGGLDKEPELGTDESGEPIQKSFRMADFASMAFVVGEVLGWKPTDVLNLLDALESERDAFINEEDPLMEILHTWLAKKSPGRPWNIGRLISCQELFNELTEIAQLNHVQFYKSSRQLTQKMRSPHLEGEFIVVHTNMKKHVAYQIWRKTDGRLSVLPGGGSGSLGSSNSGFSGGSFTAPGISIVGLIKGGIASRDDE